MFCRLSSFFSALMIIATVVGAQDVQSRIHRWTTEDGLPQNRIACLKQTRDGYLWIGTWNGLTRFDGVKFTVFNPLNTQEFAISSLAEDRDGNLWIGTKEGLLKYAGGKFHRFTKADGLPNNDIWQLAAASNDGVWLQAGSDIVRCRQDKFIAVWKQPDKARIHSFSVGADGGLNVFLNHNWVEIKENGNVRTNYDEADIPPLFPGGWRFWSGILEAPGAAVISTSTGLLRARCDGTHRQLIGNFTQPVGLLLRDHAGGIWAQAQKDRVMRIDGPRRQDFSLGEAASDVICAEEDAQGDIWVGTEEGLVRLHFNKVHCFTDRDGLRNTSINSVCEDSTGRFWLGLDKGVAVIENGNVKNMEIPKIDSDQPVPAVWPDSDGGMWIATRHNGVFKWLNNHPSPAIDSRLAQSLYGDKSHRLWVGADSIRCYENGKLQPLPSAMNTIRDVHSIAEDSEGRFWFGTLRNGLACWNGRQLSVYTTNEALPAGGIWSIVEDKDGLLWLGTEKGLVRFANNKFFPFTPQHQMPNDEVNCVLEDQADNLWFSTLHGIWRVSRVQLNAVADGRSAGVTPFVVGTADGMLTAECNGETQPSGWKTRDEKLWFATAKGAALIDPKLFEAPENPPRAVLESVKADGVELFTNAPVAIAAGHGHALAFQYTACDLTAPEQVRFRTRLDGLDRDWSEPSPERQASFLDLPPGNYRFEVLAINHHSLASAPTMLNFSIAPYFWQTGWFYALCVGGIIAVAAGIQAYRLRWQHRLLKLEQQRALANERARIARDLHDDLGTALTGVALELDVLGRNATGGKPVVEPLAGSARHIRQLAQRMREVVWVINPQCDNLRSLADFLEDQATLLLHAAGLKVHLDFPMDISDLPVAANVRHQLALSVREAFSNLIRHAHATEASVSMELNGNQVTLRVRDNGRGFDPRPQLSKSHGLSNLKHRMAEIGGTFEIASEPGRGTEITLTATFSNQLSPKV